MVEQVGQQARVIGGRYEIVAELGRGGMGIVWRARDQVIGRDVAIKELHLPDGVPPSEREVYEERVLREARTAGRLSDPGVVTVHDVLAEQGVTYIVMELVQAGTLADLVARSGPLPAPQVADIARKVVSALESAHASGIVHRDVKPANIMVAGERVKLADFGIAQTFDDPRLTTTGAIIGSPSFMAPERIQGGDAIPASDLWSLGATLFFALEGWMPFDRPTTAATLNAVLNEPPRMTRPHGAIGTVVAGLLIPDPRARFSAAQVRALLDSATADRTTPVGAGPTRVAESPHRSRTPWVIAATVFAVVLFTGGLLTGWLGLAGGGSDPEVLSYGENGDLVSFDTDSDDCGSVAVEPGAEIGSQHGVSCTDPHAFEIYADGELFGSGQTDVPYPGTDALSRYATGYCSAYFDSAKIVLPGKETQLRQVALIPTEQHWEIRRKVSQDSDSDNNEHGGQKILCLLSAVDGSPLQTSAVSN